MTTASEAYLLRRLDLLERRVQEAIDRFRSVDPDPGNLLRGLFITPDQASQILDTARPRIVESGHAGPDRLALESWADDQESIGESVRLRLIARSFSLSVLDVEMLLVALGPDVDPRLERAYGYLHDDITRRRASIGLALELSGADPVDPNARSRFGAHAPLVGSRLVLIEEEDRPFLTRSLRVPDAVTSYLLGDVSDDPALSGLICPASRIEGYDTSGVVRALNTGVRLVYVRDRVGAAALSFAAAAAAAAGFESLAVDLDRLDGSDDPEVMAAIALRQARLRGGALIAGPVEALSERGISAVRSFAERDGPVFLIGTKTWDPAWSREPPLVVEAPEIPEPFDERLSFRLTPEQAFQARVAASNQAIADGVHPSLDHLAAGARAQNAGGIERLALRIDPISNWDDLVLPSGVIEQLRDLVARVRYTEQVLSEWGLRRGSARGSGVSALFAGDSGTGKTLAAEVIAGDLDLDLYVIDLATVVDKYIGETEKNLDRIFREADRVNGVLLFDEADAIFGKRSEVQDAHDRYANIEVAYLLQRIERFEGIALLTTNLRTNIDEAFLRRLDVLVDFPPPNESMRQRLWERHLPPSVPRSEDVDFDFLAEKFELTGGNIRNICLSAAFLAATERRSVSMAALIRATAAEYRKLGRLCLEAEFGPYHYLAASSSASGSVAGN